MTNITVIATSVLRNTVEQALASGVWDCNWIADYGVNRCSGI